MVPVTANGRPAFAAYTRQHDGTYHAHEILVPTVTRIGIARIVVFLNAELFGMFGLPQEYDPAAPAPAASFSPEAPSGKPSPAAPGRPHRRFRMTL